MPGQPEEDGYTDFEYFVRPTDDLKGHILSRGAWLKVQHPQWLADEIRQWHEDALKRYDTK